MERYRPRKRARKPFIYHYPSSRRRSPTCDEKALTGIARVLDVLRQLDSARAALMAMEGEVISSINHPEIPQPIRDEYWRFWRAGGCCADQWVKWINGNVAADRDAR